MTCIGTPPWSTGCGKRAAILIIGCTLSPDPTPPRMPLRWRSAGVWIAPAHTKTCSARIVRFSATPFSVRWHRMPITRPSRRSSRRTRQFGITVAPASIARGSSVRVIVCFTPRPAASYRNTRAYSTACHPSFVAPRSSNADDGGGAPGSRDTASSFSMRCGVRVERLGAELVDAVLVAPRLGEGRGQPVVEAAVDLGAPADAAPLRERDRRVPQRGGEPPVPVLGGHLLEGERLQRVGVDPRALFHDGHVATGGGERGGGGGAARARPDHEHVGVEGRLGGRHRGAAGVSSCSANRTREWSSRTYWRTGSNRLAFQRSTRAFMDRRS